jgi:hypothetical protein
VQFVRYIRTGEGANLTKSDRKNVGAAKTLDVSGKHAAENATTAAGFLREAVGPKNRVDCL